MARLPSIPGRATTTAKKRAVIDKLMRAWMLVPELRIGQLIDNVMVAERRSGPDQYYVEDERLAELVLNWARDYSGVTVKKASR